MGDDHAAFSLFSFLSRRFEVQSHLDSPWSSRAASSVIRVPSRSRYNHRAFLRFPSVPVSRERDFEDDLASYCFGVGLSQDPAESK